MNLRRLLTTSLVVAVGAVAATGFADEEPLDNALEAGWKGKSVCEVLHDGFQQRVLKCTFPPGVGHERHYHREHFGYILTGGRMQITDADGTRVLDLESNSTWDSDGVDWHEAVNVGSTDVSVLIIETRE